MHSSFPRDAPVYRPAARDSSFWLQRHRLVRTCPSNLRLLAAVCLCIVLFTVYLWAPLPARKTKHYPPVVLVAVVNDAAKAEESRVLQNVLMNRMEYASVHGYQLAVFNASDFPMYAGDEHAWIKLSALRNAMAQHPRSEWFWYLDQYAIIMNPTIPVHTRYLSPQSLLSLPLREVPVFPPETHTRTLSLRNQPVSALNLLLSHGRGILHTGSILLRRGDFANLVLDSWNDPLLRTYRFPGGVHQAFEHLVTWRSTILEGIGVLPKRSIVSFGVGAVDDEQYHEGDFVVHLDGCEERGRSCVKEFTRYWSQRGSLTQIETEPPSQPGS